ncbi:bifunctional hydroxymethylpyrimidine kinase/phosphomethylpyrimidine kinase [Nocardioides stalactiti]|uniref:bifunctional hydroxymethylpyrimidine kinase/phosphomethylpyrimidine kinase n=1 Tax=Nocardioides stalactiti TaxID=2755356 RepID=UPI001600CB0C|nr:hydroxymethylpyrimidine/phosphomethylpyrimidine kinase [Nocardioides stalactiti]
MTPPVVLTVAATDSGGGAGIAADLATFAALGVHGACVVTAVTAQDTTAVHAIHPLPLEVVADQLAAVLGDLPVAVVKTGVLGSAAAVLLVSEVCRSLPPGRPLLVVDPVLHATVGTAFADAEVIAAYRDHLVPLADVITPNEEEWGALGRLEHPGLVVTRGGDVVTTNDHGTGCTYSSALAAHLAHGRDLRTATTRAAAYVERQLHLGKDWELGRGRGPVAHVTPTPEGVTP